MSDKSGLCLWCGRWTPRKDKQGLAECDRKECIDYRVHAGECDCDLCTGAK